MTYLFDFAHGPEVSCVWYSWFVLWCIYACVCSCLYSCFTHSFTYVYNVANNTCVVLHVESWSFCIMIFINWNVKLKVISMF